MIVRNARPDDAAAIADIYAPVVRDTPISFEEYPPGPGHLKKRMESSIVWLVAEEGDRVLGYGYARPFHERAAYRWSAEVSIYIAADAQGRGIGRELLTKLEEELRDRGYVNALAGVTLPNDPSIRLFESFGFESIAVQKKIGYKLGDWHDVGWWQKQLRPPTVPPPQLI